MSTVAEQLRHARQAQNLTVQQVAEVTKIRTDHIRALEDGNYAAFSAPVYVRGFTRCYATLLKLDVTAVMTALDTELGQTAKFKDTPSHSGQARGPVNFVMFHLSQLSWKRSLPILVALGLVALVLLVVQIWRHSARHAPPPQVQPGLYQPGSSGDTLPLPPARQ